MIDLPCPEAGHPSCFKLFHFFSENVAGTAISPSAQPFTTTVIPTLFICKMPPYYFGMKMKIKNLNLM